MRNNQEINKSNAINPNSFDFSESQQWTVNETDEFCEYFENQKERQIRMSKLEYACKRIPSEIIDRMLYDGMDGKTRDGIIQTAYYIWRQLLREEKIKAGLIKPKANDMNTIKKRKEANKINAKGKVLLALSKDPEITNKELSEIAGYSERTISNWKKVWRIKRRSGRPRKKTSQ